MTTAEQLFRDLAASAVLARCQGLDVEVDHVLPDGWTLAFREDGYIFTAPTVDGFEDQVWRLVRFLAYASLTAVRRVDPRQGVGYEMVSCMEDGSGFRVVFRVGGDRERGRRPADLTWRGGDGGSCLAEPGTDRRRPSPSGPPGLRRRGAGGTMEAVPDGATRQGDREDAARQARDDDRGGVPGAR